MPRFEAALRTRLAFYEGRQPIRAQEIPKPQTVSIRFEGRVFVWHALPPAKPLLEGEEPYEFGPSISVIVRDGKDEREAAESLQRFLSALVFRYEEPMEAVTYGGSGEPDPLHPAVTRARRANAAVFLVRAPKCVEVDNDHHLRLALALYREGVNAGSPFYGFLAFWNVLDAVFEGEAQKASGFLDQEGQRLLDEWFDGSPPTNLAAYLRTDARNAIAHVTRRDPTDITIDPDLPKDRMRLGRDSVRLRMLAKLAIDRTWPDPVRVYDNRLEIRALL